MAQANPWFGDAHDPAPAPAVFLSWDNFRQFIRANKTVTWRNFNVAFERATKLCAVASSGRRRARQSAAMRLEVVGRFPKGTLAVLEISLEWDNCSKFSRCR